MLTTTPSLKFSCCSRILDLPKKKATLPALSYTGLRTSDSGLRLGVKELPSSLAEKPGPTLSIKPHPNSELPSGSPGNLEPREVEGGKARAGGSGGVRSCPEEESRKQSTLWARLEEGLQWNISENRAGLHNQGTEV